MKNLSFSVVRFTNTRVQADKLSPPNCIDFYGEMKLNFNTNLYGHSFHLMHSLTTTTNVTISLIYNLYL